MSHEAKYSPPAYFAHASAIALGGVVSRGSLDDKLPGKKPVVVEGASCALAPGVYEASAERPHAVTAFEGETLLRAEALYARASCTVADARVTTRVRAGYSNLCIGVPSGPQYIIKTATAGVTVVRDLAGGGQSFELDTPRLELDGVTVKFIQAKKIADLLRSVREGVQPDHKLEGYFAGRPGEVAISVVAEITSKRGDIKVIEDKGKRGIHVSNVGNLFFGELVAQANSWTFSVVRADLGCPVEGSFGGPIIHGNGEPPK